MSDSPARRPASGSCCGGPRGGASVFFLRHQRLPHPETGGGTYSRSMIPPGALLGVVAGARREARTATRCANLEPKPLASSGPEPATRGNFFRGRRSPWGQLAMRHRRREARARSFDRIQLLSFPPLRRRVVGDGFRTGFAASVPFAAATTSGRRRVDRRSYLFNSPFFAPAFTGQGRGDDRGKPGRVPQGCAFFLRPPLSKGSYLVDPASSHMLVSIYGLTTTLMASERGR